MGVIGVDDSKYLTVALFMSLTVNEIFFSIQGESTFAGRPCSFIRLTGCNLRCSYCDTTYAYSEGEELEVAHLVAMVLAHGSGLVEVTGGEPLIQDSCPDLVESLLDAGNTVLVETNGSLDISSLPEGSICILDMKCPSSGMNSRMDLENLGRLGPRDELKFVIQNREDYLWAKELIRDRVGLASQPGPDPGRVLMSPVHPFLEPSRLAEWILADKLPVRLQLPLHKALWPDAPRGR